MGLYKCKKKCFHLGQPFAVGEMLTADSAPSHFVRVDKEVKKEEENLEDALDIPKKPSKKKIVL